MYTVPKMSGRNRIFVCFCFVLFFFLGRPNIIIVLQGIELSCQYNQMPSANIFLTQHYLIQDTFSFFFFFNHFLKIQDLISFFSTKQSHLLSHTPQPPSCPHKGQYFKMVNYVTINVQDQVKKLGSIKIISNIRLNRQKKAANRY